MKNSNSGSNDLLSRLARFFLVIGLIVVLYFVRGSLSAVLTPVIIAMVLGYLLNPLVQLLVNKVKLKKGLAIFLAMLVLLLLIVAILAFFLPALIRGITQLINALPGIIEGLNLQMDKFEQALINIGIPNNLSDSVDSVLKEVSASLSGLLQGTFSAVSNVVSFFSMLLFAIYFTFFFLKDTRMLIDDVFYLIPSRYRTTVRTVGRNIKASLRNFLRGQLIIALISMAMTTTGYLIIGLNYALLLGLVMGIFCLVPYVGPVIGTLPALLVAVLQPELIIGVLISVMLPQFIVGLLAPRIMGKELKIHPVYCLMGILFLGALLGLLGMLFAYPLIIIIKEIGSCILKKRDAMEETEEVQSQNPSAEG